MKKLITFFANLNLGAKTNNFLHFLGGGAIGALVSLLVDSIPLTDGVAWGALLFIKAMVTLTATSLFSVRWEQAQNKYFSAKYSKIDVALTIIGGFVGIFL